jgi:hypothetical protein
MCDILDFLKAIYVLRTATNRRPPEIVLLLSYPVLEIHVRIPRAKSARVLKS